MVKQHKSSETCQLSGSCTLSNTPHAMGLPSVQYKATVIASHSKPVAMVTRYKRQSCCFPAAEEFQALGVDTPNKEAGTRKREQKIGFGFHTILTFIFIV